MMVVRNRRVGTMGQLALVAATAPLVVAAAWLPPGGRPEAVAAAQPPAAHCPTREQLALKTQIDSGVAYVPAPESTEPVTLTPVGAGGLKLPFGFSRDDATRIVALSVDHPLPIAAKDLEAAFEGDLERSDGKKVFPLDQAAIAVEVRRDGRLVKLHVCLDPARPVAGAPGDYQGRIAWDAKPMNTAGQPLVAPGEIPVEVTLQYTQAWRVWLAFFVAVMAGLVAKIVNDRRPDRSQQDGATSGSTGLWEKLAHYTGQPISRLVISSVSALVVGVGVVVKGYYGNPGFVGDPTGDLATLFAAIFSAVVAAHAVTGAISKGRS